jgi:hypothetical protein
MTDTARYFIGSDNRAYRSEISLYRHLGETADDCLAIKARPGADTLYEVVAHRGGGLTFSADLADAWNRFSGISGPKSLHTLPVVD